MAEMQLQEQCFVYLKSKRFPQSIDMICKALNRNRADVIHAVARLKRRYKCVYVTSKPPTFYAPVKGVVPVFKPRNVKRVAQLLAVTASVQSQAEASLDLARALGYGP